MLIAIIIPYAGKNLIDQDSPGPMVETTTVYLESLPPAELSNNSIKCGFDFKKMLERTIEKTCQ